MKIQFMHRSLSGLIFTLFILLAFSVPLSFCWHVYDTFDLTKITVLYLGVIFIAVFCLLQLMVQSFDPAEEGESFKNNLMEIFSAPYTLPIFALLTVYTFSLFASWDVRISFWGQYRSYVFGWMSLFIGIFLYGLTAYFYSEKLERYLISSIIFAGLIVSIYAVFQYFGIEFARMPKYAKGPVYSSFGNPIYFGTFCMMVLPLALDRFMNIKNNLFSNIHGIKKWILFSFSIFSCAFIFIGMILSFSRSAWLGFIAGLFVYLFLLFKKSKQNQEVSISHLSIVGSLLSILFFSLYVYGPTRQKIMHMVDYRGYDQARIEGWKIAGKIFLQNPFLGTGPDTYVYAFRKHRTVEYIQSTGSQLVHAHAHNDLLQYLSTAGILGAAAFLWLWWVIFRTGFKDSQQIALLFSFTALFIHNQFNSLDISSLSLFWLLLGLSARKIKTEQKVFTWMGDLTLKNFRPYAVALLLLLLFATTWVIRPLIADIHFMNSQSYLAAQNYSKAVNEIEHAIEKNHRVFTYYERLLTIFQTLAGMEVAKDVRHLFLNNALVSTQEAMTMLPHNPDGYNNHGVVLMWITQMLGEDYRKAARDSFQKAVELDPNFVDAWINLARVSYFLGDVNQERSFWKKVLEIQPTNELASKVLNEELAEK